MGGDELGAATGRMLDASWVGQVCGGDFKGALDGLEDVGWVLLVTGCWEWRNKVIWLALATSSRDSTEGIALLGAGVADVLSATKEGGSSVDDLWLGYGCEGTEENSIAWVCAGCFLGCLDS